MLVNLFTAFFLALSFSRLIQGFPAANWIGMREYFVGRIKKSFLTYGK